VRTSIAGVVLGVAIAASGAPADDGNSVRPAESNLVKQANAPISSILQIRVQDSYAPHFTGLHGQGNTVTMAVTMPLPAYRLLPLPQLSLLSIPAAITPPGGSTGFGDLRFLDIAVLDAGHKIDGERAHDRSGQMAGRTGRSDRIRARRVAGRHPRPESHLLRGRYR